MEKKPLVYYTLQKHVLLRHPDIPVSAAVWTCATCDNVIDGMGGPGNGEICQECAERILEGRGRVRRRHIPGARGVAGWTKESKARHKEISSKGGKATAPEDRTFARDPEAASRAGERGGKISRPPNKKIRG